jgi:hypothetical protein
MKKSFSLVRLQPSLDDPNWGNVITTFDPRISMKTFDTRTMTHKSKSNQEKQKKKTFSYTKECQDQHFRENSINHGNP